MMTALRLLNAAQKKFPNLGITEAVVTDPLDRSGWHVDYQFIPTAEQSARVRQWIQSLDPLAKTEVEAERERLDSLSALDVRAIRSLTEIALGEGDSVGPDGLTARQRLRAIEGQKRAIRAGGLTNPSSSPDSESRSWPQSVDPDFFL